MIRLKKYFWVTILIDGLIVKPPDIFGQQVTDKPNPKGYFRNPLGIPMSIASNFGELRTGHWHMGLDLRTERKENYPVFAAADGYIVRVGVQPFGFGKFIVIRHANGYSTLYAHLNSFFAGLENYVRNKQYETESWAQDLRLPENLFPVKKGNQIGLSGNTGGSQGPHLHFEIRETKSDQVCNPLLFGFPVEDKLPPHISRLAIYNRDRSTYLQDPVMVRVMKSGSRFLTAPQKILTGYKSFSIAIEAIDKIRINSGTEGIYRAELIFDNQPVIDYIADKMDYDETRFVGAHIDLKIKNRQGPYLQHLSLLPGYRGPVYTNIRHNGILVLKDTAVHSVRIRVFDVYGNVSDLDFSVQFSDSLAKKLKPIPQSKLLTPGMLNIHEEKDFEAFLPEDCLYDTVPVTYSVQNIFPAGSVSAQHRFGDPVYPVHTSFSVRIKPIYSLADSSKSKLVMVSTWGDKRNVRKAEWHSDSNRDGWVSAWFDEFGSFQVFTDYEPPKINTPGAGKDTLDLSKQAKIVFTPVDNSGIKSFRAELDGKWLMFSNDKSRSYVYKFDEKCPYGVHHLKVRVEDLVGNVSEKTWWFKRYKFVPPTKAKPKPKTSAKKK